MRIGFRFLLIATLGFCVPQGAPAQNAVFTYHGRLADGSNAAHGNYEVRFALFDMASGGNQVGNTLTNSVAVNMGVFIAALVLSPSSNLASNSGD